MVVSGLLWYWRLIAQGNMQPAGPDCLTDNPGRSARSLKLHSKVVMEILAPLMVAGDSLAMSCNV